MENLFGITEEDIENFQEEPEIDFADIAAPELEHLREVLEHYKDNTAWMEKARLIASLPGLDDRLKAGCIFMGLPHFLGLTFLVHGVGKKELSPYQAVAMFHLYCDLIGMESEEISHWFGFFFGLGVLPKEALMATTEEDLIAIASPGSLTTIIAVATHGVMSSLILTTELLQPMLEELGIDFWEDDSLLEAYTNVVSIEDLAPAV